MTYTIKDEKGNTICSIENVDPVRSSEKSSIITGTSIFASVIGVGIGLFLLKINKTRNIKKIIEKYGKDKLNKVGNYIKDISENSFKMITDYVKTQCKNKVTVKFIDDYGYSSNGFISPTSGSGTQNKMIKKMIKNSFDNFTFPIYTSFELISSNISLDKEKDASELHENIISNIANNFNSINKTLVYKCKEASSEYNENSKFYITEFTLYYNIKLNENELKSILN